MLVVRRHYLFLWIVPEIRTYEGLRREGVPCVCARLQPPRPLPTTPRCPWASPCRRRWRVHPRPPHGLVAVVACGACARRCLLTRLRLRREPSPLRMPVRRYRGGEHGEELGGDVE